MYDLVSSIYVINFMNDFALSASARSKQFRFADRTMQIMTPDFTVRVFLLRQNNNYNVLIPSPVFPSRAFISNFQFGL